MMRSLKQSLAVAVLGFGFFALGAPSANAQVRVGVGVGVGPAYGGYGYDPYYDPYYASYGPPPNCAYGYYPYSHAPRPLRILGSDYFYDGVFVGVGLVWGGVLDQASAAVPVRFRQLPPLWRFPR